MGTMEENTLERGPPKGRSRSRPCLKGPPSVWLSPSAALRRAEWRSESSWVCCTELRGPFPALLFGLGLI